jgi:hypothetical protein
MPNLMRCYKPGCRRAGSECYVIAFEPYSTVKLCKRHYEEITLINTLMQTEYERYTTNDFFRWHIWYRWLHGELKVRKTGKTPQLVGQ